MSPIFNHTINQRMRFSAFLLLTLLLTACGGGGGGGDGGTTDRFTVRTSVGANGGISPTSVTLNENGDTTFTVTPDTGFSIDSVTGCGGSLTSNSYTTGPITADCTVTVSFSATPITSFELIDPTPGAGDKFGTQVVILGNGNIVVTDPSDSSVASNNGAVHLYNPVTQTVIASIYGDDANDTLGSGGITALANSNFVINSPLDDVGAIRGGSVQLVNGETGVQIGTTLTGDFMDDQLGSGGITALANNRFVIASPIDNENGVVDAGSVRLVTANGIPIGTPLVGNDNYDRIGLDGVTVLANNYYVVASSRDRSGSFVDLGSVQLVNANGIPIGNPVVGNIAGDRLGFGSITALANGNYVIAAPLDAPNVALVRAGSVRLMDGMDGTTIGTPFIGNDADDELGGGLGGGITALANNNFVITSPLDDDGVNLDAGSVILVNGEDGQTIVPPLIGDETNDFLGSNGVTALANNHFVIASPREDNASNGFGDAGSIRLVNGDGQQINVLYGDAVSKELGSGVVTALANSNYVLSHHLDDINANADAGSVKLFNGSTGDQIGVTLVGDVAGDQLSGSGVTALPNNNFVVASYLDNEGGIADVGSVRLVNGVNGVEIASLSGNNPGDAFGYNGVTVLANSNYVTVSALDSIGGLDNLGSAYLINGTTGAQIGTPITGNVFIDFNSATVTPSDTSGLYIFAAPNANNNGATDSGLVRLVAP